MPETAAPAVQDQSHAQAQLAAAYRQVFGNAHLMEEEQLPSIESLFINGDLNVQGLVTAMAQSDTYRRLFLDQNGPYRFVELNFKHLLGRAPRDQQEVSEHVQRLANEGYEAEIASYTTSEEYLSSFGLDTVPHLRALSTMGQSNANYTRNQALDGGRASFDGASQAVLLNSIATGEAPALAKRKSVSGAGRVFRISWSTGAPVGVVRRASQTSVVSYGSLSRTIQSIQARGGRISSISQN